MKDLLDWTLHVLYNNIVKLTCHIVFLRTDLHLSFIDILDYGCAVQGSKSGNYWSICSKHNKNHVIFLWFLPEITGGKFGFGQRERRLSHHLSHLSLSLKKRQSLAVIQEEFIQFNITEILENWKKKLSKLTSIILRRIWRKRIERASAFFLSRLRPVWAPFSRAFMMVWALQAHTEQNNTHFTVYESNTSAVIIHRLHSA